jgi:hypothetical protein
MGLAIALQCSCTTDSFTLSAPTIPGQSYYLVLDGCAGAICDYEVTVLQGSTLPVPPPTPVLQGPGFICKAGDAVFSIANYEAGVFNISVSPPTAGVFTAIAGNQFLFTASPDFEGQASFCATAFNACGLNSADQSCLTVDIIPQDTTFLETTLCEGTCAAVGEQSFCAPGDYEIALTPPGGGCDNIVYLSLHYFPSFTQNIPVSLCPSMVYIFNGDSLWQSGIYTYVYEDVNGCDSTYILELEAIDTIFTEFSVGICTGESYFFGGQALTVSGTYIDSYLTQAGCDSIVRLQLQVLDYFETQTSASICAGDTFFFNGTPLHDAGTYFDTLTASGGCDSIIALNLEIWPGYQILQTAVICAESSFLWQGEHLTQSGTYNTTLTTINGCDSLLTLELTVLENNGFPTPGDICPEAPSICADLDGYCGSLGFNILQQNFPGCGGNVLNNDEWLAFVAGDTVISLLISPLNCLPQSPQQIGMQAGLYEGACMGPAIALQCSCTTDTFTLSAPTIPGQSYYLVLDGCAGAYCDYHITVLQGSTLPVPPATPALQGPSAVCQSGTAIISATNFQAGDFDWIVSPPTAGSLELLGNNASVQFMPHPAFTGQATICATVKNACDIVSEPGCWAIDIGPLDTTFLEMGFCENECITFGGIELCTPGVYEFMMTSVLTGCDSIVALTLFNYPAFVQNITANFCEGDIFVFNGDSLAQAGVYSFVFSDTNGCDSTVVLDLVADPIYLTDTMIYVPTGTVINNIPIVEETLFSDTLVAQNGCDSIINQLYIPTVGTHNAEASLYQLNIYPNPAGQSFFIDFYLKQMQPVQVEVLDVTGRYVLVKAEKRWYSGGRHTLEISSGAWAPGVYLVRLISQGGSATARLIKA